MSKCAYLLGTLLCCTSMLACRPEAEPVPTASRGADILLELDSELIEARVPRHATLAGLLQAHQVSHELANRLVHAASEVFDVRRIRADHAYQLERTFDGLVREFRYQIDADRFLRIVQRGGAAAAAIFQASVEPYVKRRALVGLSGEITPATPSLVAAVDQGGEASLLAMAVADVLGGEVDFNSELQPNDTFAVLFEKLVREGEFAGYGDVVAAEVVNEDRRIRAFRFTVPGQPPGYYDEQGRSLKRMFLRSPLRFEPRITSGFTRRRFHPILKTYRPHLAIDYAAPQGAPVNAVASGVVVQAAYTGGGGNQVRLRHSGGYETYYLHLSAFGSGIRRGARVNQGDLIGRVGATGMATAPHLDYRMRKDGVWVNPLVEHRKMPPGEPVPAESMAAFGALRDDALARLGLDATRSAVPDSQVAADESSAVPVPAP